MVLPFLQMMLVSTKVTAPFIRVPTRVMVMLPVVQAKTCLADVALGNGNTVMPRVLKPGVTMLQPGGSAGAAVEVQKPPGSGLCGSRP